MTRSPVLAATTALTWWWLGAGLASADLTIMSDLDRFHQLADENDGFPTQTFRSSDIVAPVFHVNSWDKSLTDDTPYIFLGANYNKIGAGSGPIILDASDLSLVYADQNWTNSYHSEIQTIHGKPHLTFWAHDHDRGEFCVVVDDNYNIKYKMKAVKPYNNDMHEFHVTDEGTAVFTTHRGIKFDCSRWGGSKDGRVHDTGFQEVDLETGKEIFSWAASDHFDPDDSYARFGPNDFGIDDKKSGNYDLSHMNSARKTADGNYLVSSRHFFSVQLIDGKTGDPIWTLGGKMNDFEDLSNGTATNNGWQHNARFYHNQSHITMFDNHNEEQGDCGDSCETRGLHVEIDTDAMTARVVREYYHPGHLDSGAMGGMQLLDSGNAIVGWGWTPSIVEYAPDGRVAMDIQRGRVGGGRKSDMFAYRVFKSHWTGRPHWPPSVVVDEDEEGGNSTVYMSWNGATDIAKWAVFSSHESGQIDQLGHRVDSVPRAGFETSLSVSPDQLLRYIAVVAVDKKGEVLGMSEAFDRGEEFAKHQVIDVELPDESEDEDEEEGAKGDTKEDTKEDEDDDEEESKATSYAGPGSVFAGLVVSAGAAYGVLYFYRRRRASRRHDMEAKYSPVLAQD